MSLRGRGAAGSAARTARVVKQFGLTAGAMAGRLDRYLRITEEFGVRPTWPTTACVLARHPELLRRYAASGVELAVHGLVHGDHALLDRGDQQRTIAQAFDIFARAGITATGFRGPYLRYNTATLEVLRNLGFRYDSSQAVAFPLLDGAPGTIQAERYRQALALYSAHDSERVAVVPHLREGLVDLPVAVPDDESLLERLQIDESARRAQWVFMFGITYDRGELFTVQLHPERIDELGSALRATLVEATRRTPRVFIATLDEIAGWWLRRSAFRIDVSRHGEGVFQVRTHADPDATVLVRGANVPGRAWSGKDFIATDPSFEVRGGRAPMVGVSRRSPETVWRFLRDEGFPFELSDAGDTYGAYLDIRSDWTEADVLATIEKGPGPLVRLWRWPSGARSALSVTGDIDALTLADFFLRTWETRSPAIGGWKT